MRLLLVEDEVDLANALALWLRAAGYAVDLTGNGLRAWELAEATEYDLLILDLNLPGLDGLEVCRRVRANRPSVHILMLTARDQLTDRVLGPTQARTTTWSSRSITGSWPRAFGHSRDAIRVPVRRYSSIAISGWILSSR